MEYIEKQYKANRRHLRITILKSKEKCWTTIVNDLDNELWGQAYRIIMKKAKVNKYIDKRKKIDIVKKLFFTTGNTAWSDRNISNFSCISPTEVCIASRKLKCNKAPGPDGIPAEVVQLMARLRPDTLAKVFNAIIKEKKYPKSWKTAQLALIEKPRKKHEEQSYRPLCMIDATSKLFEIILRDRLEDEIKQRGNLNRRQFGFRSGYSTIDPLTALSDMIDSAKKISLKNREILMLVTIDVKNAFNCADWKMIIAELEEHWKISGYLVETMKGYLSDRYVAVDDVHVRVTRGVPQGSILGPLLWNILYDGVLRQEYGSGVDLLAYADDLALIVKAKSMHDLRQRAERATEQVCMWMDEVGLEVAPQKTEAVVLIGGRRDANFEFHMRGKTVRPNANLRYLGVTFQAGGGFTEHIKRITAKAEIQCMALSKLMPNWSILGQTKRKIMATVQNSTILYGAEAWGGACSVKKNKSRIIAVQRRLAIRICRGYRTISADAAQVLAGITPIDLKVLERYDKSMQTKAEGREATLEAWVERWNDGTSLKATWTRELIRNLKDWIQRNHGELGYAMTQFFTGHGCFEQYLYRIRKADIPACSYGDAAVGDAGHVLFVCGRWDVERKALVSRLGINILTAENLVPQMLESANKWSLIREYMESVMHAKHKETNHRR